MASHLGCRNPSAERGDSRYPKRVVQPQTRLRELAVEVYAATVSGNPAPAHDLETLERTLTVLEEKLFAALRAAAPEDLLVGLKEHAARELAPYRSRMGVVQLRQVEAAVCANATAGALQFAAAQPFLYEPAMKQRHTSSLAAQSPPSH